MLNGMANESVHPILCLNYFQSAAVGQITTHVTEAEGS